jgi:GGDEF domain-containing protein
MSRNDAMQKYQEDPLSSQSLPGVGTRETLITALETAVHPSSPPALLVIFRLEELDDYASTFGPGSARSLLARLVLRLAGALPPDTACFQPRWDELAALVPTPIAEAKPILDAAAAALRERSGPVAVSASWGAAMLPEEAGDPIAALELADERLASTPPHRKAKRRDLHVPGPARRRSDEGRAQ